MTGLHIAPDCTLPIDAVTETFGILAKKGAGKSNAAVVMAEEMYDAGVPWVAIDPKGDWWGLRSSADGQGAGLPIVVFGGRHGDVPLEPTAGALIADLVLKQGLTCVLDVSEFSKADVRRFLLAFAERLYRQADSEPLHLFLEEAHEYLPQMVRGEDANLVNAWQRIVKQGRFKGLGCTLVTQRSAALNKDVLTQVDTLIVLRTTSPQDRAAVKAWVDVHADAGDMLATLPSLESGEAWLWSPETLGMLKRIRFRRRRTFDSGATPKVGQKRRAPATLADVDLAAIKEQMAETIEKAKADDPKLLKAEVARLAKALTAAEKVAPPSEPRVEIVHVPVVTREVLTDFTAAAGPLVELLSSIAAELARLADLPVPAAGIQTSLPSRPTATAGQPRPAPRAPVATTTRAATHPAGQGSDLTKAQRALLGVLVQHEDPLTAVQLSLLSGYSVKSSSFSNALGALRSAGYAEGGKEAILATMDGEIALGPVPALPAGRALVEHWMGNLGKAERTLLGCLLDAWPTALSAADLSAVSGYSITSSSFSNALGRLRTLQLAAGGRDAIAAAEELGEAWSS